MTGNITVEKAKKIHVSYVKKLLNDNILSYDQAALIFKISVGAVYKKYQRLEKGELKQVFLSLEEMERLYNFTQKFDDFIDSLTNRLNNEEMK